MPVNPGLVVRVSLEDPALPFFPVPKTLAAVRRVILGRKRDLRVS